MSPNNSLKILGVRVDNVNWSAIDQFCRQALETNTNPKQIVTVNGEFILAAQKNQQFKDVINNADLVIPDSTNVVWASKLKKQPLTQVTPGSDLTLRLAELASKKQKSIFLLGAKPGIAKRAADKLRDQFPKLTIAGTSHANPDQTAVKTIITKKPDILLVAYSFPTQEIWIAENKNKLPCKLVVGVGGTFDMIARVKPRAPKFMRLLHLEWLWRLILEPKRLPRIWKAVVVFPAKVLFDRNKKTPKS